MTPALGRLVDHYPVTTSWLLVAILLMLAVT